MKNKKQTPTEQILECLEVYRDKGLKLVCQGGAGFILPRFWIFDWQGERYSFTKTRQLKDFLHKVSLEWAEEKLSEELPIFPFLKGKVIRNTGGEK